MICPSCRSAECRRSKRRGMFDRMRSLLGFLPWRCRSCRTRFWARRVAVWFLMLAHCPKCGNMELQRIARSHVVGAWFPTLWRVLFVPAYRCDACRHRFFSMRWFHPIQPSNVLRPDAQSTGDSSSQ